MIQNRACIWQMRSRCSFPVVCSSGQRPKEGRMREIIFERNAVQRQITRQQLTDPLTCAGLTRAEIVTVPAYPGPVSSQWAAGLRLPLSHTLFRPVFANSVHFNGTTWVSMTSVQESQHESGNDRRFPLAQYYRIPGKTDKNYYVVYLFFIQCESCTGTGTAGPKNTRLLF